MSGLAFVAGSILGTMSDPFVIGAGVTCYFIAKSWQNWMVGALAAAGAALALFTMVSVFAQREQMQVDAAKFLWFWLAISAWFGISYGIAALKTLDRTQP